MLKGDPRQLALDLLPRSICAVQVSCVISDRHQRVVSWGWNGVGTGFGEHAEAAAVRRGNRGRMHGATAYVAAQRRRNGKQLCAMPCVRCWRLLKARGVRKVWFSTQEGWEVA